MSHVPHDLHEAFPADAEVLHALKLGDAHYQRLAARYHEVNREIHRIESEIEPASDEHLEGLKKQRLGLLDDVADMITRARASA